MKNICVVTGGTGGIGSAAVKEMAKADKVLFCDVNQGRVDAFAAELKGLGFDADGMVCDVSDRAQCDALAQKAASMGKITGVIHLAGLTPTFAKYDDILRVDCLGTMNINEAFFKVMEGGCIIDICSCVAHFIPFDRYPTQIFDLALTDKNAFYDALCDFIATQNGGSSGMAYVFGRCFVYWYARKCAYLFGRRKHIRVLTVSVNFVETPMSKADLTGNGKTEYAEKLDPWMTYSGCGRPASTGEIAFLFSTLLDERNSYLSGIDINFDNCCNANGYHGQTEPYDPNTNPYDPEG